MRLPARQPGLEHGVALAIAVDVLVIGVRPLDPVERRLRQVDVAHLDERPHVAEQQGEQQGRDVLAVDVGIRHQHDLVVPRLLAVEVLADPGAERRDHRLDLLVAERAIEPRLLDVQDLAAQRQDRLRLGVAAGHRGAAGRVALDQEDLAQRRAAAGAVAELARHPAALEQPLATGLLARLARRDPGGGCLKRLADDVARLVGVAVEPVAELTRPTTFCTKDFASVLPSLVLV